MKKLLERLGNLKESRGYDSEYLQKGLKGMASDEDDKNVKKLLLHLRDRLNQTHPDGDVSKKDVISLMKEPDSRTIALKCKNWLQEIDYIWDAIG